VTLSWFSIGYVCNF